MKKIMVYKKIFTFLFVSNLIFADFSAYDIEFFYPEDDFRRMYELIPFPSITVDERCGTGLNVFGGTHITYTCTPNVRPKECPLSVIRFLEQENIQDVQFFKARWWHLHAPFSDYYNYLTQLWAMERMPHTQPQSIVIASGIFEPQNLEAFNSEIGINSVVEQTMSYDGYISFQGNARFKLSGTNIYVPTSGWFVSVYDPQKNTDGCNFNTQHQKKAIVVFVKIAYNSYFGQEQRTIYFNLVPQFMNRVPLLKSKFDINLLKKLQ